MDPPLLRHYRCQCGKLLFKANDLKGKIEIKCKRCGVITTVDNSDFKEIHRRYNCVTQINAQGIYTYISDNTKKLLGYTQQDMIDKSMFDFYFQDDVETKKKEFKEMAAMGRPFRIFKNKLRCHDGRLSLIEMSYIPYHTDKKYFIVGYTISAATF